jgi:hypothetical protein
MTNLNFWGERFDSAPAGYTKDDFLQDADFCAGIIEFPGDAAIGRTVQCLVGIEQVKLDAPDQGLPEAQKDCPPGEVEMNAKPSSVRADCRLDRHRARVVKWICLVLHAGGIDHLTKIPLPGEEADSNYRQAEVACGLKKVAGQDAEAAGV